jgi:hypothetical protein
MAEKSAGLSILKWSAVGCLGCLGVVVLFGGIAVGVGWLGAKNTKIEPHEVARDLPRGPEPPTPPESLTPESATQPAKRALAQAAGRVVLDLRQAGFKIEPGEPGGKVRVEGKYDKRFHELEESLEEPLGHPWVYHVRFKQTGGGFLHSVFAPKTEVTIYLPPDVPIDLEVDVQQGGAEIELGGLWLTMARISAMQGGCEVSVSEPLHAPMDRFDFSASMGGAAVRSIGNASPAEFNASVSMGGMHLDLRGAWAQDAQIGLDASMGDMDVRLPSDVTMRGLPEDEGSFGIAPEAEVKVKRPTLTFEIDSGARKNIKFR